MSAAEVLENPLPALRRIRDIQRRARALDSKRNRLIRQAIKEGNSHRQVGIAAGLSCGGVSYIVHKGEES
jgi:hypothetical protein